MVASAQFKGQAVTKALNELQKKVANRRPVHRTITRRLVTRVQLNFKRSRDPWGGAWEPLKLRNGQPLRDTGRLFRSIPAASTSDDDSSTIGTNVRYGLTHQEGRTIKAQPGSPGSNFVGQRKGSPFLRFKAGGRFFSLKEATIPARPFLPIRNGQADLPADWENTVLDAIQSHLQGPGVS